MTVPMRLFCSLLPVFGVRVSVTFHLICVHIIFSSVWVAKWPSAARSVDYMISFCFLVFVILVISRFSFAGWFWVLIASVPGPTF